MLPIIISKSKNLREIDEWDLLIKEEIRRYKQKHSKDLANYVGFVLPDLLKACKNTQILKLSLMLIRFYDERFKKNDFFIETALVPLLKYIDNEKKMRKIKTIIQRYSREVGNPDRFTTFSLPIALKKDLDLEKWYRLMVKIRL